MNFAFFSLGFRPFFLFTAFAAIIYPMYLVTVVVNNYPFDAKFLDITSWHAHELVFGMLTALLSGFLLTAVQSWTKKETVKGFSLFFLSFLWISIRLLFIWRPDPNILILAGPLPLIFLIFCLLKPLKGNKNIFIVIPLLTLLGLSQYCYLWGAIKQNNSLKENGMALASYIICNFLIIFSGRLIPFFSNSYANKKIVQTKMPIDISVVIFSLFILILQIWGANAPFLKIALALLCACLLIYRNICFYHKIIWHNPMLYLFYFANLWPPLYFILMALESHFLLFDVGRASIHSLFTGGVGSFSILIMTRATLGHTGRALTISKYDLLLFSFIFFGALLRIFFPIITQDLYHVTLLHLSMGFWTTGFILFLFKYAPLFFRPNPSQ